MTSAHCRKVPRIGTKPAKNTKVTTDPAKRDLLCGLRAFEIFVMTRDTLVGRSVL